MIFDDSSFDELKIKNASHFSIKDCYVTIQINFISLKNSGCWVLKTFKQAAKATTKNVLTLSKRYKVDHCISYKMEKIKSMKIWQFWNFEFI